MIIIFIVYYVFKKSTKNYSYGTEQVGKGEDYDIKNVVIIVITCYDLIEDSDRYHNRYRLVDINTKSTFSDIMEIDTLELSKVPKETDNTYLWDRLRFLKSEKEEDFDMITTKYPKLLHITALDSYELLLEFSNCERRVYVLNLI